MEKNKELFFIIALSLVFSFVFIPLVEADAITDDIHLNLQITNSTGSIETGTYDFVFNISNNSDCAVGNVIYSNSSTLATDTRGVLSYYLPDVTLDYDIQYWLCYYRYNTGTTDLNRSSSFKMARSPYAFNAKNVTLSGVEIDTNLEMTGYNVTADYGFFNWLGNAASRVSSLFVTDINASGNISTTGNVSASWFFGSFSGNTSIWSKTGAGIFPTTIGDYLGLGTSAPETPLHIQNATGETQLRIQAGDAGGAATLQFYDSTGGEISEIYGATDDSIRIQTSNADRFAIDSAGEVGIGTNTPNTTFHIKNDTGYAEVRLTGGSVTGGGAVQFYNDTSEAAEIYNNWADNSFRIQTANQDRLTVDNAGQVGVGTTSPGADLQVNTSGATEFRLSTSSAVGTAAIQFYNSTGEAAEIYSHTDNSLRFQTANDNDRMTIDSTGNVGIGTTSPSTHLEVNAGASNTEIARFTGSVTARGLQLSSYAIAGNNEVGFDFNAPGVGSVAGISFSTVGSEAMRIDKDGNIGIGTTTPQQELNVLGDANVTGTLYRSNKPLIDWSEATNGTLYEADDVWTLVDNSTFANIDEPLWTANYTAYNDTWTTTDAEIWTVVDNSTFANIDEPLWTANYTAYNDTWTTTDAEIWSLVDNLTFANIDEPLWTANYTAYNDTWTTTDAEIWSLVANDTFVPYTGANANVVLGNNNLSVGGTDFFVNNNDGRVGIGTSSPSTKLEINGTGTSATTAPILTLNSDGAGGNHWAGLRFADDGTNKWGVVQDVNADDTNSLSIYDYAAGASSMHFSTGGNVGIGTTNPDGKLDVIDGNAQFVFESASSDRAYLQTYHNAIPTAGDDIMINYFNAYDSTSTSTTYASIAAYADTVTDGVEDGGLAFGTRNNGAFETNIRIKDGYVGINTTTPTEVLEVRPSLGIFQVLAGAHLGMTNTNANIEWTINPRNSGIMDIAYDDNVVMAFENTTGNVGMGNIAPNSKLEVTGTFNASTQGGSMRVDSNGNVKIGI